MVGDTLYTDIKFVMMGVLVVMRKTVVHCWYYLVALKERFKPSLHNRHEYKDSESLVPLYFVESLGKLIDLLE